MPGMRASLGRSRLMTSSAVDLRSAYGLSVTNTVPVLPAPWAPPTNDTVWDTSGSWATTALTRCCRPLMAADEMSCDASEKPDWSPVSCCG